MFSITDTSLCSIDISRSTKKAVRDYCKALLDFGIDTIEMPQDTASLLSSSINPLKILIRTDTVSDLSRIKKTAGIVCDKINADYTGRKILEKSIDEITDEQYQSVAGNEIRLIGGKKLFAEPYGITFRKMLKFLPNTTSFCTINAGYASTALMIEWVLAGGKNIVTAFMGTGGYAPMEEVVMALRTNGYDLPRIDAKYLYSIGRFWETLTGYKIPEHKPVAGKNIFHVESGVHVNGIMKNSRNYEPFSPEEIGSNRKIVLGKYSGKSSVLMKLKELNLNDQFIDIDRLLQSVKILSSEYGTVSDKDFLAYISEFIGDERNGQKKNLTY